MSSGYTPIQGVDYDVIPPKPEPPPRLGTLAFPEVDSDPLFESVVFINTVFRNDATGAFLEMRGSGALVGRNDILTASHVVSKPGYTLLGINIFTGVDDGLSDKDSKLNESFVSYTLTRDFFSGEITSVVHAPTTAWNEHHFVIEQAGNIISGKSSAYDVALIGVSAELGLYQGFLPIASNAGAGHATILGYPAEQDHNFTYSSGSLGLENFSKSLSLWDWLNPFKPPGEAAKPPAFNISGIYHSPGSSGGPILDNSGNVIGVVSSTLYGAVLDGEISYLNQWMLENNYLVLNGLQSTTSLPNWAAKPVGMEAVSEVPVTRPPNTPPVALIDDHSLRTNEWSKIASRLSYLDNEGDAATRYQFYDEGTGESSAYFWTPTNMHNSANTIIEVAAADLNNVWLRAGQTSGSETMWVRAFDGTYWGDWDSFNFTTTGNTPPVATIADHTVNANEWAQAKNWLSYSDADGNTATKYQFWDGGTDANSGYFYTSGNAHNPAGQAIEVAASDLANVWVRGGQASGSEIMYVRAFDGSDWSAWDQFNLTTIGNTPPVATIADHSLAANQWSKVQGWVSYSDANGNAATQYQFWDGGTGSDSGYFWTPDNAHNPANTSITVAAADLGNVWVSGGQTSGSETMYVRAFDGTDWSAWNSFNFTTLPNTPPVATINDHSLAANQWSKVQGWVSYSDANGSAATQYQFWDGGTGSNSGYFWTPDNAHNPANTAITVAAANLGNVWVSGGQTSGSETMYVRAFDGTDWSAWDSFNLTTIGNTPPVATIADHTLANNQWSKVQGWVSYSDANGNAATQYQFWDGGTGSNSGYFWTPDNAHNPANTSITVAAADLGNVWVSGGAADGSETMYIRAFDGTDWSAWDAFTLLTV